MPPNAPIFTDAANRLRYGHVFASDVAHAVEAISVTNIPRLPSTRPLDHRWDRSRGIIFYHAKRPTCPDRSLYAGGALGAGNTPASRRPYAIRPIGSSNEPKLREKAGSHNASYVDNPHKATGFGVASNKQIVDFKATIGRLEDELALLRRNCEALRTDKRSQSETIRDFEQDRKSSIKRFEQLKLAHKMEVEKMQRTMKQGQDAYMQLLRDAEFKHDQRLALEKKARDQEVEEVQKRAAAELEAVRESAAEKIASNAPILEAARREGERTASDIFNRQLEAKTREMREQQALHLQQEAEQSAQLKALQNQLDDLRRARQNEKQQHAAELASQITANRVAISEARADAQNARDASKREQEQRKRILAQNVDLRQLLAGREARKQEDRADYAAYRELFRTVADHVHEVLASVNSMRDTLRLEAMLWSGSVMRFQSSKELLFFRQQPQYNDLKRNINDFLESRSKAAQAAADRVVDSATHLFQARKGLALQGHATRMVTRHLHFVTELTDATAVSVVQYMALILPFRQRRDECDKRIADLVIQIQSLENRSAGEDVNLEGQLDALRADRKTTLEYIDYAEAFRRRVSSEAILNSSVEDRVTFVQMRSIFDKLNLLSGVLRALEEHSVPFGLSWRSLKAGVTKARDQAEGLETIIRKRLIVQQELGQLQQKTVDEADEAIRKLVASHKRDEDLALSVIAGRRKSMARSFRARKAEHLRAAVAASKAATSIEDLQASLSPDVAVDGAANVGPRSKSSLHVRSTARKSINRFHRRILSLRKRRMAAKAGERAAITEKIDEYWTKYRQAKSDYLLAKQDRSGSNSKSVDADVKRNGGTANVAAADASSSEGTEAASSTSSLSLKPTAVLQTPISAGLGQRQCRVWQWPTSTHAAGGEDVSFAPSLSTSSSAHATGHARRASSTASEQDCRPSESHVATATLDDQLKGRCATSSSDQARALEIMTTSDASRTSADERHEAMQSPQTSVHQSVDRATGSSFPASSRESAHIDNWSGSEDSTTTEDTSRRPEPHTLLDYHIPQNVYRDAVLASPNSNAAYWSHQLYKSLNGKSPEVYYCKTLETAERQCKLFLAESVLGFDLEWEINANLHKSPVKKCVSLIQIAAEDKICLIHLALFTGDTVAQLIPPALKAILEDANVAKAGVNVNNDALRMKHCFGVNMKGIFELSHMYRLVKTPKEVSFRLVNMAQQVQNTLLLPLKKDEVRVSAWSKSLNRQQCAYAAADAYAGFRLFHELDNMRKDMRPTPPRPAFFETQQPIVLGDGTLIQRSKYRPRSTGKKASQTEGSDEEDVFFDALEELPDIDAPVSPAQAGSLGASDTNLMNHREMDIDKADPDSVSAMREVLARAAVADEKFAEQEDSSRVRATSTEKGLISRSKLEKDIDETGEDSVDALPLAIGRTTLEDKPTSLDDTKATTADASQDPLKLANKPAGQAPHVLVASPETILADMWIFSLPARNPKVGAASLRAYHLWHHQRKSLDAVAGLCRQPPLALTTVASYVMTAIKEESMPYESERLREAFVHLPKSVWHVYAKWVKELGLDR